MRKMHTGVSDIGEMNTDCRQKDLSTVSELGEDSQPSGHNRSCTERRLVSSAFGKNISGATFKFIVFHNSNLNFTVV